MMAFRCDGGVHNDRIDRAVYGIVKGCSFWASMMRRSAGTSFVVACTRAFATSRSHLATAALAAFLSGFSPACRIEATNGTQKLRFRYPMKRSTLPFVCARYGWHQRGKNPAWRT